MLVNSPQHIRAPIIWLGTIAAGAMFVGRAPYFAAEQKAMLVYEGLGEIGVSAATLSGIEEAKVDDFGEDLK